MTSLTAAAFLTALVTCIIRVQANGFLSRIGRAKSVLVVKSEASAEIQLAAIPNDNGADFPFRLPSALPGHPAGPRRCATRLEFEQHCYGFIYAVVGDPTQTDEHTFTNEVGSLCGTTNSSTVPA